MEDSMVKIDRHYPMPTKRYSRGRVGKYPWKDMKVGDSIVAKKASYSNAQKKYGYVFTSRKNQEGEGYRIWRIK